MEFPSWLRIIGLSGVLSVIISFPVRATETFLELEQPSAVSRIGGLQPPVSPISDHAFEPSWIADASCLLGSPDSTPGSVTVIERETIEQQAVLSRNVQDILIREAPGVSPSINRGRSRLFVRGRPAKILIDGVPVGADVLLGLEPELVEQIEVIAGPNSRCY